MNLLRRNKTFGSILVMSLLILIFVPSAMAFESREGESVTIAVDEVVEDDLYVGTNIFILNGTIKGDLIVGATEVLINGTVEGDVLAGAQFIEINGAVLGDARLAASAIELGEGAEISEDLLAFGYSLHAKSGSQVGQELVFGGYQALLDGDIAQDVWVGANSFALNGRIGGNVNAEVGGDESGPPFNPSQFMPDAQTMPDVPTGITLGNNAKIEGDLTYRAPRAFAVSDGSVNGTIDFTEEIISTNVEAQPSTGRAIWQHVRRFITLALIGALLIWRTPSLISGLSEQLQENPLPSLGWGAAVYFGTPIVIFALFVAAILLALLFGGLQFGNLSGVVIFVLLAAVFAFMVCFVLVLLYLTKIIIGYSIGQYILERANPTLAENPYWSLLLGLLLVIILMALPFLGGLINWLIAIVGVGTVWLLWRSNQMPAEKAVS